MAFSRRRRSTRRSTGRRSFSRGRSTGRRRSSGRRSGGGTIRIVLEQPMSQGGVAQVVAEKRKTF